MKIIDIDVKYIFLFIVTHSMLLISDVLVIVVYMLFIFNTET